MEFDTHSGGFRNKQYCLSFEDYCRFVYTPVSVLLYVLVLATMPIEETA